MRSRALLVLSPLLGLLLGLLTLLPLSSASAADPAPLPSGSDVDYQLGGRAPMAPHVGIIVRDRTERPVPGRYNVCYVNGFQTQPDQRGFWRRHWGLVLKDHGRPVVDEAWGEWLLDLRSRSTRARLATVVGRWVDRCAADGFAAVEFDNLDSFTRSHDLLQRRHALAFARLLVARSHAAGLAAGQKNLAGLDGTRLGFDFAVSESCSQFNECDSYVRHYGTQVLMIDYRARDFRRTCAAYGASHPVVLRDLDLTPGGVHRWC